MIASPVLFAYPRRIRGDTFAVPHSLTHMTAALIISLRESFETALIVCVMLAFLRRTETARYDRFIWAGLAAGAAFSLALSVALNLSIRTMPLEWRSITEGVVMIAAAILVGWMTVWMAGKSRSMKMEVEQEMSAHIQTGRALGIFLMSFLSTAREGAEMVIMVQAAMLSGVKLLHAISGVATGITGAAILGWVFFRGMRRISLRHFFAATGIVLLLLGTGLSVRGIGLLAGTPVAAEAHVEEEGLGEEIMEVLLGTSEMPSPLQMAGALLYLSLIGRAWYRASRRNA